MLLPPGSWLFCYSPASVDDTAPAPSEITVYTGLEDDQISEYLPLFNAQYPDIKVNIVRASIGMVAVVTASAVCGRRLDNRHSLRIDLVQGGRKYANGFMPRAAYRDGTCSMEHARH